MKPIPGQLLRPSTWGRGTCAPARPGIAGGAWLSSRAQVGPCEGRRGRDRPGGGNPSAGRRRRAPHRTPPRATPRHARALVPLQPSAGPQAGMGALFGTVFKPFPPAERLAASGSRPPLSQTPRKISTDSSCTLKTAGEPGRPGRPPRSSLPPPPGCSAHPPPGARGRGGGSGRGPSVSPPEAHYYSLSLGASAQLPVARAGAVGPRAGERSRRGLSDSRGRHPAPGRRLGAMDAPTRELRVRLGGCPGFRALEAGSEGSAGPPTSGRGRRRHRGCPRPLPAHPGGRGARGGGEEGGDALAPGPPPPLPPARAEAREKR